MEARVRVTVKLWKYGAWGFFLIPSILRTLDLGVTQEMVAHADVIACFFMIAYGVHMLEARA